LSSLPKPPEKDVQRQYVKTLFSTWDHRKWRSPA
jgi:hypothetical protein